MNNEFGKKLADLRKKNGYTQQELVDAINRKYGTEINRTTISKWENGTQEASMSTVKLFADFWNVSMDYLNGIEAPQNDISEEGLKVALFGGSGEVTDAMWQEVINFAKYVKEREMKKDENK